MILVLLLIALKLITRPSFTLLPSPYRTRCPVLSPFLYLFLLHFPHFLPLHHSTVLSLPHIVSVHSPFLYLTPVPLSYPVSRTQSFPLPLSPPFSSFPSITPLNCPLLALHSLCKQSLSLPHSRPLIIPGIPYLVPSFTFSSFFFLTSFHCITRRSSPCPTQSPYLVLSFTLLPSPYHTRCPVFSPFLYLFPPFSTLLSITPLDGPLLALHSLRTQSLPLPYSRPLIIPGVPYLVLSFTFSSSFYLTSFYNTSLLSSPCPTQSPYTVPSSTLLFSNFLLCSTVLFLPCNIRVAKFNLFSLPRRPHSPYLS